MKKILAILLVLVMTVGLVPAVFAADETYTITINNTNAGHTYEAYQIFKGTLKEDKNAEGAVTKKTLSDIEWGDNVDTSQLGSLRTFINTQISDETKKISDDSTTASDYADAIASLDISNDSDDANALAKALAAIIANNKDAAGTSSAVDESENSATISGLSAGYYIVMDKAPKEDSTIDAFTAYILQVVSNVTVKTKADTPTIVKKVDDINDTTGKHTDGSNNDADDTTWIDSADYDIGDDVPFQITVTTGDHIVDFTSYTLTIHDKQSEGLTAPTQFTVDLSKISESWASDGTVTTSVTVSNTDSTKTVTYTDTDSVVYTAVVEAAWAVTTGEGDDATTSCQDCTDCTFHINITFSAKKDENPVKLSGDFKSKEITVNYTATLNSDAVIGNNGNPNDVYLEYSNNPYGDDTGKTTVDTAVVFTYKVDVTKYANEVDGEGSNKLNGATFSLWKKIAKPTGLENNSSYEKYGNTETPDIEDAKTYYYEEDEYIWIWLGTQTGTNSSEFTWRGIDDGTYKLVEEKAPEGYNKLTDPIVFEVTAEHVVLSDDKDGIKIKSLEAKSENNKYTFSKTDTDEGQTHTYAGVATNVVNKAGSSLPETGGIGTTIFYCVGGLLAVGAAILLITKKRMTAED